MTVAYLDTSAALKLVVEEPESGVLIDALSSADQPRLVSSWLLHTEMHCAAGRHPKTVDREIVNAVLEAVDLLDVTRGDLLAAGAHAPLRSLDAIHLAVALRVACSQILTYDAELAEASRAVGLVVHAPSGA